MLMDATIIRLEILCEPASVPNHSKGIRCVTSFASVEQKTILLDGSEGTTQLANVNVFQATFTMTFSPMVYPTVCAD